MAKKSVSEQAAAVERLKEWIKPGDTIYCILRHRSSSGMSRVISLKGISIDSKGKPDISEYSYNVALALGYRYNRNHEGVSISGCGMDMGFAIVDHLSHKLFGTGYQLEHRWI